MQSKTCNRSGYSVRNDFSCQLLQRNAYSRSFPETGCEKTRKCWCEMVLNFIKIGCQQFCDAETCTLNFMGGQCVKQQRNAICCTRTSDTVTCGDKSVCCSFSNSYSSDFISSAPSTASQGLATQISTVQRKGNSHTWCE